MVKIFPVIIFTIIIMGFLLIPKLNSPKILNGSSVSQTSNEEEQKWPKEINRPAESQFKNPPSSYLIPQKTHVFQTFNNCGPAALSMILSYSGINKSQSELGQKLRPYQNTQGDNDDKSVSFEEFLEEVESYGLVGFLRPNGDIEKLKVFVANDIPVVTKTYLHDYDDIGHYRLVRGYDENKRVLIQDDSYEGKGLEFSYEKFLKLWQPFNYQYVVIVEKEKQPLVEAILGEELDEIKAWENSLNRALDETTPNNPYLTFNRSVAHFYLGDYEQAVQNYEQAMQTLPWRMLWYQIEPILAYQKLGNYQKVFEMTNGILNNHNRAFSELYLIRGEVYLEQGRIDSAKEEFEKAVFYNRNSKKAQEALKSIQELD